MGEHFTSGKVSPRYGYLSCNCNRFRLLVPGIPRTEAVAAAVFTTLVELIPSPVNDNLLIPMSAGITLSLMRLFT